MADSDSPSLTGSGQSSRQNMAEKGAFRTLTKSRHVGVHPIDAHLEVLQNEPNLTDAERELRFLMFRIDVSLYTAERGLSNAATSAFEAPDTTEKTDIMVRLLRQRLHRLLDQLRDENPPFSSKLQRLGFRMCELLTTKISHDGAEFSVFDLVILDLYKNITKLQKPVTLGAFERVRRTLVGETNVMPEEDCSWTFVEASRLVEQSMFFSYQRVMPYPRFALQLARRLAESIFHRLWDGENLPLPDNKGDRLDYFLLYRLFSHCRFPLHIATYIGTGFRRWAKELELEKLYGVETQEAVSYALQLSEFCDLFVLRVFHNMLSEIENPTFEDAADVSKIQDDVQRQTRIVSVRRRFFLQPDPNGETVFGLALKTENVAQVKRLLSIVGFPAQNSNTTAVSLPSSFGGRLMKYLFFTPEFVAKLALNDEVSVLLLQANRIYATSLGRCDDRLGKAREGGCSLTTYPIIEPLYAAFFSETKDRTATHPLTLVELNFGQFLNLDFEQRVRTFRRMSKQFGGKRTRSKAKLARNLSTSNERPTGRRGGSTVDVLNPSALPASSNSIDDDILTFFEEDPDYAWNIMHEGPGVMEKYEVSMYEVMTTLSDEAVVNIFGHHHLREKGLHGRPAEQFLMNSAFTRQVMLFIFFFVVQVAAPQIVHYTSRQLYPVINGGVNVIFGIFLLLFGVGIFRVFLDVREFSTRRTDTHCMASVYNVEPTVADTHSVIDLWQVWMIVTSFLMTLGALIYTGSAFMDSLMAFEWGLHIVSVAHIFGIFLFVDFYLNLASMSALSRPRTRGLYTELNRRVLSLVSRRLVAKRESTDKVVDRVFRSTQKTPLLKKVARYLNFAGRSAILVAVRIMFMIEAVLLDTLKFVVFLYICTVLSGIALTNVYNLANLQEPIPWDAQQSLLTTLSASFTLFFAMFGLADINLFRATPFYQFSGNYDMGSRFGYAIFGFYLSVVVILLLNLLISLMVTSAERVNNRLPAKIIRRGLRRVFASARTPGLSASFGPFLAINLWTSISYWTKRKLGWGRSIPPSEPDNIIRFGDYNKYHGEFYLRCMLASMVQLWSNQWTPEKFMAKSDQDYAPITKEPDFMRGSVHYVGVDLFSDKS